MTMAEISDADVHSLLCLAVGYGSWFVGVDQNLMLERLREVQVQLRETLSPAMGPDEADAVADNFPAAVVACRKELEAAGRTSRVVN
jgi:hypothetical protein